jgi:hypothetical protein
MLDGSGDRRLPADRGAREQGPYASSHRALAACARELARLVDTVRTGVAALHLARGTDLPVQRRTPSRCIVQLGPVALTIAWLQHATDTVADGELLVAVWSGAVATSARFDPERAREAPPTRKATLLWEEVLKVDAEDEASWRWQLALPERTEFTSAALAERCLERLQLAYDESRTDEGRRTTLDRSVTP